MAAATTMIALSSLVGVAAVIVEARAIERATHHDADTTMFEARTRLSPSLTHRSASERRDAHHVASSVCDDDAADDDATTRIAAI